MSRSKPADLASQGEPAFRAGLRAWISDHMPAELRSGDDALGKNLATELRRDFGAALGKAGWLSLHWPREFGGEALSSAWRIPVLEELVRLGAPEPMNSNALGILAPTLIRFGTEDQCRRLLPPMVTHDTIWCQGFSEPGAGSDLASLSTRGVVAGDELVITGQKVWTSHAKIADSCYLLVRTEPSARKHDGISLVVLDLDQPGVEVRPLRNIVGTEEFCEVFFDEAVTPLSNVIGTPGQGWSMAMYALEQERSSALAQRSLVLAQEFERLARLAFDAGDDRTSSLNGAHQNDLVDAYVRAAVTSAVVRRAVTAGSNGQNVGPLASIAKLFWSESHQRQLDVAAHLLGPRFVADDQYRGWFDATLRARAETIYGGTSEVQRNIIARHLGLSGSSRGGGSQ